ncbi:hypothetical protein P7H12_24895 [Paenibacillus larvae]|nr:hypothetical protein [Paenibacillus larvae]MDT2266179.1 hypothetical protein [Paenibacillus larvae]
MLEERFGDALAAFNKMIGGQGEDETSPTSLLLHYALLFAGLAHEDEALTETAKVDAKIGFDNMSELGDKNYRSL